MRDQNFTNTTNCCCTTLQFDGLCIDEGGDTIAKCSGLFNSTSADCKVGNDSTFDQKVLCSIGSCTVIEDDKDKDKSFEHLPLAISVGSLVTYVCVIGLLNFYKSNISRKGKSRELFELLEETGLKQICGYTLFLSCATLDYEKTIIVGCLIISAIVIYQLIELCIDNRNNTRSSVKEEEFSPLKLEATDVYQNFSTPLTRVIIVFLCQGFLLVLYAWTIYVEGIPDFNARSYCYYAVGCAVQIAHHADLGSIDAQHVIDSTKYQWFADAYRVGAGPHSVFYKRHNYADTPLVSEQHISKYSFYFRMLASIVVNVLGRDIILMMLPLHLAHSVNEFEFLSNSVGAYFIIDLYMLSAPVKYTMHRHTEKDKKSYLLPNKSTETVETVETVEKYQDVYVYMKEEDGIKCKDVESA